MIRPAAPRPKRDSTITLINVVFLMLIFFLMTAQITPPPPFEMKPPGAASNLAPSGQAILHISPEGALGFTDRAGDEALAAAIEAAGDQPLRLKADGGMEGAVFAKALGRLSVAGVAAVELTTAKRVVEAAQ